MTTTSGNVFGIVGEFRTAQAAIGAARALKEQGYRHWDVFSPAPIEGLEELIPSRGPRSLIAIMVGAAVCGACVGYFIQWWSAVLDYPLNVAGHPYNGWPGFVPSAWEVCALFAVYAGFFGFLIACRLPKLYHPIFAAPDFERASQDRFFVCVEATDPRYDRDRISELLGQHGGLGIAEIRP